MTRRDAARPPATAAAQADVRAANLRGMAWMLGSAVSVVAFGLFLKDLTATLPVAVIVLVRMLLLGVVTAAWPGGRGWRSLATRRLKLHFVRSVGGFASLVCFVYALSQLLFADAMALNFTMPLWSVALSIPLLGESVGWRRGLAILAGFGGVLLILRPGGEVDPVMLVALAGAILTSLTTIVIKKLTATEPALRMVFYYNMFGALLAAVPAVVVWRTPGAREIALLALMSVLSLVEQVCALKAFAAADVSVVAPVSYVRLPIAVLAGLAFYGEWPSAWSLAGIAVILASLVYVSRRSATRRELRRQGGPDR